MKLDFKLLGLIIFIVIATLGSIYFFSGLKDEKRSSQTDILTLVPAGTTSILQINSFGEFLVHFNKNITINRSNYNLFKWLPILSQMIVPHMKQSNSFFQPGRNTLLISFHEEGEVYYVKMHTREMQKWKKILEEEVFSSFPPMVQHYKEMEIYHYPLNDNRFFSSVMKDGVFVGSFNLKLLQQLITNWEDGTSVKNDENFTHIAQSTGKTAIANLFHHIKAEEDLFIKKANSPQKDIFSGWTNSDITFSGNEIWLSGFYQPDDNPEAGSFRDVRNEGMQLSPELIPNETLFLRGQHITSPRLQEENDGINQLYTLYIADSSGHEVSKINCVKTNAGDSIKDEFQHYLKEHYPYGYSVRKTYSTQPAFDYLILRSGNILNEILDDSSFEDALPYYITFYKDNIIIGENPNDLALYMQKVFSVQEKQHDFCNSIWNGACNTLLVGNVKNIVNSPENSYLKLSEGLNKYATFLSDWHIGTQVIKEDNMTYYHCILSRN
ncbi:MAG: hypothetical protein LUG18_08970 [Candidatus Azobacteroides sp.]|nr:hypothetical protein [Candidatus Azobacteroides sp.]